MKDVKFERIDEARAESVKLVEKMQAEGDFEHLEEVIFYKDKF